MTLLALSSIQSVFGWECGTCSSEYVGLVGFLSLWQASKPALTAGQAMGWWSTPHVPLIIAGITAAPHVPLIIAGITAAPHVPLIIAGITAAPHVDPQIMRLHPLRAVASAWVLVLVRGSPPAAHPRFCRCVWCDVQGVNEQDLAFFVCNAGSLVWHTNMERSGSMKVPEADAAAKGDTKPMLTCDEQWEQHINFRWDARVMQQVRGRGTARSELGWGGKREGGLLRMLRRPECWS